MQKNKHFLHLIILFTVAATLFACNRKTVFAQYEHTPLNGWERNDTLKFLFKPSESIPLYNDTIGEYDFKESVELRINNSYPFKSLYLEVVQTRLPAGITQTYTVPCHLVNQRGLFKGKGVNYYQYHFHFADLKLRSQDSVQIFIRHNMKREILPGVSDVGIRITK